MDKYCRTCFRNNDFKKFDIGTVSQISDVRIDEMLMYCLQVEISAYDRLPQQICEACLCVLNSTFLFRKHCYHSETEFRKILKYAPPELHSSAPNMELELDLLVGKLPDQDFHDEAFEQESEELANSISVDPPPLEKQETLIVEDSNSIDETTGTQPVVVKKYRSKVFECEQCDHRASFKGNLVRHQQCRNHTGIRVVIPNDKAPLKAFKKLQQCEECGFHTFIRSNFSRHQRIWKHTKCSTRNVEVEQVLEKCPKCPHCGALRANLQAHIAQWCPVLRGHRKARKYVKKSTSTPSRKRNTTIVLGGPSMETNYVKIETEDNIEIADVDQNPEESSNSISLEKQETLIVEDSFVEPTATQPVVVKRYLSKVFECEQCDYRASFKGNLVRHQQNRNHTGIRVVIPNDKAPLKAIKKLQYCEECGFQTFVRSNFSRHQKFWKHTKSSTRDVEVEQVLQKCPKCPHCGAQRANLPAHIAQWCPVLLGHKRSKKYDNKSASTPSRSQNAGAPSMQTSYVKIETEGNIEIDDVDPLAGEMYESN